MFLNPNRTSIKFSIPAMTWYEWATSAPILYKYHRLQYLYRPRIKIFLQPAVILVSQKVARRSCVKCESIEQCFKAHHNPNSLYQLLFKYLEKKNSFISFRHLFAELNIMSNNGTVCTVKRDGRPGGVQMITFTEKLTNLKYELLMAYFDRDIRILRY